MRTAAALLFVAGLAAAAHADKKIQDLTPGFVKEAKACAVEHAGLVKVVGAAKERIARMTAPTRSERERELVVVTEGLAAVAAHCQRVAGYVAFLEDNKDARYKAVERTLDEHDHAVRKLRRAAKASTEAMQPQVRALIALNAERDPSGTKPTSTVEPRRTPAKFPSRRTIELPTLPGSWKLSGTSVTDTVEYAEPATRRSATITARGFTGATCAQQRVVLAKRTPDLADLAAATGATTLGVAWSVRAVRKDKQPHLVSVMCMPAKTGAGGVLATSDVRPATDAALADELAHVLIAMLAAHAAQAN